MSERFVPTDLTLETQDSAMSPLRHPLYPQGEPLLTQHNLDHELVPTVSFLRGYATQQELGQFFDEEGRLIYKSDINPYDYHGAEINRVLGTELITWYGLVQKSYLKGHNGDFNNHLTHHVSKVARTADQIRTQADPTVSQEEIDNTRISGMLHDDGGIFGRVDHAHLGLLVSRDLFPQLLTYPKRFASIGGGIALHDESYYRKLTGYGHEPFDKRSRTLRVTQTPLAASVVIADKTDVDRLRVYEGARNKPAMDRHNHSEVNMFTRDLGITVDDESIQWTIAFNPYIHSFEIKDYKDMAIEKIDAKRFLAYSSPRIRNNPLNPYDGINFEKVWKELCFIYGPKKTGEVNRIGLTVDTALTWFRPKFQIHYLNPYDMDKSLHMEFTSENVDDQLAQIAEMNAVTKAKGL